MPALPPIAPSDVGVTGTTKGTAHITLFISIVETLVHRGSTLGAVTMPDLVAMNATTSRKILDEPAQPLVEGGYALRVVHTTGRRSGERRATPLGVVQVDGALHLISPDRSRAWVRNIEADPHVELAPGEDPRRAVPADPEPAARAISAYLKAMQVPWALRAFPMSPEASHEEITEPLDSIAVYRLDPR